MMNPWHVKKCVNFWLRGTVPGWYHTMDEKNIFGETGSSSLSIGDIVEWSRWNPTKSDWDMNYGIITNIDNEIRSNRLVSICKVLPLNEPSNEMEFFTLSLRLISSGDKREYMHDIKN